MNEQQKSIAQYIQDTSSLGELQSAIIAAIKSDIQKRVPQQTLKNIYLGRKGLIAEAFTQLATIATAFAVEKKDVGATLNALKNQAETLIISRETSEEKGSDAYDFDPTYDKINAHVGKLHPITREKILTEELFMRMGFDIIEDNLVENDFNVFQSLNLPENHPARDMWDTFWTEDNSVLRVHTTAFQNHLLVEAKEKNSFPIRAIQPGLCFRNEATDARHEHTFYQVDGLYVEEKSARQVSIVDLISTLRTFFSQFFEKEMDIRIQPAYFPFVEPGFEFAISCIFCEGKGCSVCSRSGWIEIGGTGMVHPNVFTYAGLDPEKYSGYAFGYGLDRMAQLKLDINDVRLFRSNDIRFISHT